MNFLLLFLSYCYCFSKPTSRQDEGGRGEEEEVGGNMMEMSMKTQAANQEVMVASRREAMGRSGEEEADARGTRST